MCDTYGSSGRKELERLEASWMEFEEFAQWVKQRWTRRTLPASTQPDASSPGKTQPATG